MSGSAAAAYRFGQLNKSMEVKVKNILLLVHDDEGQEARLQAALDVTRAVEGHLTCLDVVLVPELSGDLWDGGAAVGMLLADERTREAANRVTIEDRLKKEGVPWTWVDMTGDLAPCLQKASTLAELIVVNRHIDGFPLPDMRGAAAELIVRSGKPVLAVPDSGRGLNVSGHALVAWDGSSQADRALQAAVPLLKLASQVTILQVDDGSVKVPAGEAASLLSRHDIHPLVVLERSAKGDAKQVVLSEIVKRKADYVVMGGFGQSRLAEALFGGVSRKLLSESPVPLLMAH